MPEDVLPTKSDFRRLSFRLSYPLLRTRSDTLVLRGVLDMIEEEQVAPTLGNAVLYDDRYRALRAGFDWSHSFGETRTLLSFGGDISQGIPGLGSRGEWAAQAAPMRFAAWRNRCSPSGAKCIALKKSSMP